MKIFAILTESIRYDNQHPLRYFSRIKPVHFYQTAPYGDLTKNDLKGAIQYENWPDLEQKLLKLKPDIIQGAEPYGSKIQLRLCHIAWRVSRKLNIPLVFGMLENRPVNERFGPVLAPMLKKVLAAYAKQAMIIFYLNSGAKRNLLEAGAEPSKLKKLLYGIWGVDTAVFRPSENGKQKTEDRKSFSHPSSVIRHQILFVGRLDEAKGIAYLLEAWKMVRRDYPHIELVMAGKGEMENIVKKEKGIRFLGMVKNQDLPALFNSSLFTVYPSVTLPRWEEQVGMVNLQSLACGTPVITTKSGAIPEYINSKVGILVPERDSKALAKAMRKLLSDSKYRKKLGRAGRQYILENFDAQKTIVKTEGILLELLRN
jgi:glycosyltransferase involved in cell wall biosynthesis